MAAWGEATIPHLKKVVAVLINIGMFDQLKRAAKMLKYCGEDIDGDVATRAELPLWEDAAATSLTAGPDYWGGQHIDTGPGRRSVLPSP